MSKKKRAVHSYVRSNCTVLVQYEHESSTLHVLVINVALAYVVPLASRNRARIRG